MKTLYVLAVAGLMISLIGCVDPQQGPVKGEDQPHGVSNVGAQGRFKAGQFVMTIIDNASFFNDLPMAEVMPDLFLMKGTSMRVIAPGEAYSKVELDDGRIGYVMSAMVIPQPGGVESTPVDLSPQIPTAPAGGVPGVIDPGASPLMPRG